MESETKQPGILEQAKELVCTGISALQTRGELLMLEVEEERTRLVEMFVWALAGAFLAAGFLALLTVLVIFLFPADLRIWALIGFCLLYLAGSIFALLNLKSMIQNGPPPFKGTLDEMKKDKEWLESLK